jgi:hypothetical protein
MEPPESIPEFLIENLQQLDEPTLLAIALHAESRGPPPEQVPDEIENAIAMQDDATTAAIGRYAQKLAEQAESPDPEPPVVTSEESSEPTDDSPERDMNRYNVW